MKFNEFLKKYKIGKSYPAPDGTYTGQCVSLVKCYIKDVLGTNPQSIGDAKQYWLKRKEKYIKSLFKPLNKNAKLKKGDVFIRTSGVYGHIGIIRKVDDKKIYTIEQNNKGCKVVKYIEYNLPTEFHFLRPLNQDNLNNKPSVEVGQKVTLTNANVLYTRASKKTYLLVSDLTEFKCPQRAQLKVGTKVTVRAVDTVKGNMWIKIKVNGIECYIIAYDKKKDKAYIK